MAQERRASTIIRFLILPFLLLIVFTAGYSQQNEISSSSQSKKLYVLDAGNDHDKPQVLVLDRSNGKVIQTYPAGYQPDMVLSPDGTKLYLAYGFEKAKDGLEYVLDIYDTTSGARIDRVNNSDVLQHKLSVYATSMIMSPSGKQIYMEKYRWQPGTPGPSGCYISTFDTQSHKFKYVNIVVSNCGHVVLPAKEDLIFQVVSVDSHAINEYGFTVIDGGGIQTAHGYTPITLPVFPSGVRDVKKASDPTAVAGISNKKFGPVFWRPQEKTVGITLGDGSRLVVNLTTKTTTVMGKDPAIGKWVGVQPVLSESNLPFYFGTAQGTNNFEQRYDHVVRADAITMGIIGKLKTSIPFFSMCVSPDGDTLFTVNPERATVTMIDALGLIETRQFSVGHKPIFAIAAP